MADIQDVKVDPAAMVDVTRSAQHRGATMDTPVSTDSIVKERSEPSVLDTAGALWLRESVVGSILADTGLDTHGNILEHEEGYNPYRHFSKNREEYSDLEPYLRSGAFDNTRSSSQFMNLAAKIRLEKDQLKLIEQGSGWGLALGMGLSLIDVTTLIPFAKTATASRVGRAFAAGASGVALGVGQEAILHSLQETRTATESFLNIGVMGGVGIAFGALAPLAMRPDVTSRALDVNEKPPVGVTIPGRATSEAEQLHGSVGAAAATGTTREAVESLSKLDAPGALAHLGRVPGAQWLGKKLFGVTPVGRSTMWSTPEAREATQKFVDMGGIFTRFMTEGAAHSASVEDLKLDHMMALHTGNYVMRRSWQDMAIELGAVDSRVGANLKSDANLFSNIAGRTPFNTGLTEAEFQDVVRRKLTNSMWQQGADWGHEGADAAWFQKLVADRGLDEKSVKVIEKHTDASAKEWQRLVLEQEDKMVKLGMITEEQRLGNKYGHAQLWNRENVNYDREQFRAFLIDVFSKRPDPAWLAEQGFKVGDGEAAKTLTIDDFNALPVGDKLRTEIMETWVGAREEMFLERARTALDAARKSYQDALQVSEWTDLGLKVADKERAHWKAAELRAEIRTKEAEIALEKLEAYRSMVTLHEGRVAKLREQLAAGPKVEAAGGEVIEGFEAVQRIGGVLDEATAKGNVPAAENLTSLYERAVKDMMDAQQRFQSHMATLQIKDPKKIEAAIARASAKLDQSVTIEKLEGRVKALAKQESRVEELNTRLADVQSKRKAAWDQYKQIREGAKRAGMELKEARKGLGKASRAAARAEKRSPLLDTVDDIVNAIADHQRAPLGMIENTVGQSGRVKDRRIILTGAERRLAEERGFLHTDLQYVMDRQFSDVSARLAMRETFGEELGNIDKSPVWKRVYDSYQTKIDAAKSPDAAQKLKAEREAVRADLELLRDRMLGRGMTPDDPESFATWGMNKLRQATYLRFAAGFPLSSLTDAAAHVLHVGFGKQQFAAAKHYFKILKDAGVDPKSRELLVMVNALEMSMAHSTASKQFMLMELNEQLGIGAKGTTKKAVTGAYDRVANTLASRMNVFSGMAGLNAVNKAVAGMVTVDKWATMLSKYESLSKVRRAELASVGIGRNEAKRLNELLQKYGKRHEDGFDANAHMWHAEKDGEEMHRVLRVALRRTMNRASPTPGYGDLPRFMSKPIGQLLFQFQSYAFGSVNRVLVPAMQRGLGHGDARSLAWLTTLVAISSLVSATRAYMNGKDPADFTAEQWTKEIIDRGGLLAFTSPYVDATLKLTGLDPSGVSSRYRHNNWWHSLLGPSFSTIDTVAKDANAAIDGDWAQVREKTFRLTPFNQWFRLGNSILNPPD